MLPDLSEDLHLALPWNMFGVPSRKRKAEMRVMSATLRRLAVMMVRGLLAPTCHHCATLRAVSLT